ncbi:Alpha/Beta hydrolase protein [Talaromyces proteolyticus]|uniref:Alpha/Beta hydrolase protein n=1 Tax=Talaromyces proteolyticus TaxID=1131652 RepID=A0AAD4KZZ3_9EURO|nr:Alpha/Beta hydrolase protein [Talaromyces proteolyticus]KAH8701561.1 Alpha/Beta hydrolase protein [Talaromyces proteolyticus]
MMPLSIRRKLGQQDHLAAIRASHRFSERSPVLCEKVSRQPHFEGYWVCRGSIKGPQKPPCKSNVVLLWLHGGGYITGTALAGVARLLRIAEMVEEQNLTISIFALEYSLTPEAQFPAQVEEAISAYRYLIKEERINPNSIFVLGESAGGHLALSLAYGLHLQEISRPGKVGLLYPWVNLSNSGSSFHTNKYSDCLDKEDLDRGVDWLLGKDGRLVFADFLNFASSPRPKGMHWADILPSTWVTIGGNDLLISDVSDFVEAARKDGVLVDFHIEPAMPHGWLNYRDSRSANKYLSLFPSEDATSLLRGSETIAGVICAYARSCRAQK